MRVGDGVSLEAGNSIRNDAPVLINAEKAPEKGRKGNSGDHQDAPQKTAGIKRKADEIQCPLDTEEGPSTSKRQLLGLGFLSTALQTLNPLKNFSKFMGWGRAEEEIPVDAPQPSLLAEPTLDDGGIEAATEDEPVIQALDATDLLVEEKVKKTQPRPANNKKKTSEKVLPPVAPAALPVVTIPDSVAIAATTTGAPPAAEIEQDNDFVEVDIQQDVEIISPITTVPLPSTAVKPEPTFYRPSAHYSPPVAKAIKVVKRSELKRQLQEQRAPVTNNTTTVADKRPNPASTTTPHAPAVKNISNKASGKSRGSRLLTLAHDKTPLAVVSMALAPPTKTPRAAFGLDDINITPPAKPAQQQEGELELESENKDDGAKEHVAGEEQLVQPEMQPVATTIPVALEPSPEGKLVVHEEEEQANEDDPPVELDAGAADDANPDVAATDAAIAADVGQEETATVATQPTPSSGISGSPLSLAQWGEPAAEELKERENKPEPEESQGTVNALLSVALAAMGGGSASVSAPISVSVDEKLEQEEDINNNPAVRQSSPFSTENRENDEAVAMEIDDAPALVPVPAAVPASALPATEVEAADTAVEEVEVEVTPSPLRQPEVAVTAEAEAEGAPVPAPAPVIEDSELAAEDDKQVDEPQEQEKDAVVALVDGVQVTGNQFTPLPRLLPRWGISSGGDSAATSPSSCSLLPLGLSGGRNPSYKISKPGATAPAAANSPSVALRSHKKNSGKADDDENDEDMNDGAASTHGPLAGEEGSGRRVRFVGVEEIEEEEREKNNHDQEQQDGDGEKETVCRPSIRPLPPPVCRTSSANGRTHLTGAQPRFGIGAFVRIPASTTATTNSTTASQQSSEHGGVPVTSPPDAAPAPGAAGNASTVDASISPAAAAALDVVKGNNNATAGNVVETSPPVQFNPSIDQDTVTPLVITRRLQHSGTLLRRAAAILPAPLFAGDSIPQILREAFLNARLAEHWCRGEAWSRLDLSGIELVRDGDREAHLNAVIATLIGQRGDTAVQTALDQLQIEWEHLKCFRQKYVSPSDPDTLATHTAPKSILKHASGVSPPSAPTAAGGADHTPPIDRNSNLAAFEDILAAEVVPGSTSPHEWAIGALAGAGHTGHLTPGLIVRSRGIKMLASLHNQAGGGGSTGANGTPPDGSNVPGTGQTTDVVNGGAAVATRAATAAAAAAADSEQQHQQRQNPNNAQQLAAVAEGRRRRSSNATRRGASSRGHRLLQALQNAAGPQATINTSGGAATNNGNGPPTTAAAAAARLIVDSSNHGGDGGDFMTGPMATSFVTT